MSGRAGRSFLGRTWALVALALAVALCAVSAQTPVRDLRREPTGTANIAGTVQTSESTPRPLRLAAVTLSGDKLLADRQFYTGDDGRFEFSSLPAGQYRVTAFKPSYMREAYGAKQQGGAGASIMLGDGQTLANISIGLSKYGVITGTIYDQNGEPAQGVSVEVMAYSMRTGRRALSSVYGRPQTTDDRGVYRAGGLVPGEYFVAAGPSSFDAGGELQVLSVEDVDRTLQARPPAESGSSANAPAAATSTHMSFAPVFFPGTTGLSGATAITLKRGEERAGVDFALRFVPTARIGGTVTGLDGQPVTNAEVVATLVTDAFSLDLFRGTLGSTRPDARGRFSYPGVSPGHYVLTARSAPDPSSASGTAVGPLWALAETDVNGANQSVTLVLQPGVSVSGKVVFDGTTLKPPATMSSVRVAMPAEQSTGVSIRPSPPTLNPDGSFTITGAPPGKYKLTATPPTAPAGWMVRSATVNGVDALDVPFDVRPNQPIDGVVVTFTDHPTELSGTLQTPAGIPTANYFIIVFATDKAFWTPSSRRTVMVRPATTGRYVLRNLPPGEFFVAAVTDVQFNAWFDPAFLESLVAASTRVTLAESEKRTLDLKIVGG